MTTAVTAPKNPFPAKAVASLGGALEQQLRTVPTRGLADAANLARDYVTGGGGQLVTVEGASGSGKSHLINYVMSEARRAAVEATSPPRLVQIYAKTESADFVALYRELIKQIGYKLLRELNAVLLGTIALREIDREQREMVDVVGELVPEQRSRIEATLQARTTEVSRRLRQEPDVVFRYLDSLIVRPEVVLESRGRNVDQIAGTDFKKAFLYLDDIDMGDTAYKWFTAAPLSDAELRRLGVSAPLTTAEDAKHALRLLVTLFHVADIRFLAYVDQVERLLTSAPDERVNDNAGQLHTVAEFFPREHGFLLLAGQDEGWQRVSDDFWTRVGPTRITMGAITPTQSRNLVKLYLQSSETYEPYTAEAQLAPFVVEGIDEILRLRGGNVRQFLQTGHQIHAWYERELARRPSDAPRIRLDAVAVRQALTDGQGIFDRQTVLGEVRRILRSRGAPFESGVPMFGREADYVLGRRDNPSMVIEITDALFYVDEAVRALDLVAMRDQLLRRHPQATLVVIATGYVSGDVLERLGSMVDECLVYEGRSFEAKFTALVDAFLARAPTTREASDDLRESRRSLEALLKAREADIAALSQRLDGFIQAQSQQPDRSAATRRRSEWRQWLRVDQETLERRQAERVANARDERQRLQQEGDRLRLRRALVRALPWALIAGLVILATYVVFLLALVSSDPNIPDRLIIILESRLFLSVLMGSLVGIAAYALIIHPLLFPLGFGTNDISRYSGDLGQVILRARAALLSDRTFFRCLRDPNPLLRYFAVQSGAAYQSRRDRLAPGFWLSLAAGEAWMPLYISYLKQAATEEDRRGKFSGAVDFAEHLRLLIDAKPDDPRVIHAISVLREYPPLHRQIVDGLAPAAYASRTEVVRAHATFEGLATSTEERRGHALLEFAEAYARRQANRLAELAAHFQESGQFARGDDEVVDVPLEEEELRLMIDALSPHRDGGLASFHELSIAPLYLRLYRFLSEVAWLADHGRVGFTRRASVDA